MSKKSKKIKQHYLGDKRRLWEMNPVTKVVQSKRDYNRQREHKTLKTILED